VESPEPVDHLFCVKDLSEALDAFCVTVVGDQAGIIDRAHRSGSGPEIILKMERPIKDYLHVRFQSAISQ
jgi:hypothetical protein